MMFRTETPVRSIAALLSICLSAAFLSAQDAAYQWLAPTSLSLEDIPRRQLALVRNEALQAREAERRRLGAVPQFAEPLLVDVSPEKDGIWELLPDGREVWRCRIASPGAYSLNLGLTRFHLPKGAFLSFYDPEKKTVLGPFSSADNDAHDAFWTPVLNGDELVEELLLSDPASRPELRFRIGYVNHDFEGFAKTLAGNCNVDVLCGKTDGYPEVDSFREAIQSVAMYTVEGSILCTGFLVNNTRNDCTPYFVTARHCEVDSANAASVVVYWNYQNSDCRQVGSQANGRAGNGTLDWFNSGAMFRASYSRSDMVLLELDDALHPNANAFFAGWNADTLLPKTGVAAIHHASSEEKRFSYSGSPVYLGTWAQGAQPVPTGDHVIVPSWDMGVTEKGSSGAPLFNKEQQVIGQLHGGAATCTRQAFDSFGWIGTSWEGGGAAKTRLRDWLDPLNTGMKSYPGRKESQCQKKILADTNSLQVCLPAPAVFTLYPNRNFRGAVSFAASGLPQGLRYSLDSPSVPGGDTVRLTIESQEGVLPSVYPILVEARDLEDTVYLTLFLDIRDVPALPRGVQPVNGSKEVPVQARLHWPPVPGADRYFVEVAELPTFANALATATVSDTFFLVDSLEYQKTYFWRLQAINACGEGPIAVFTFTTAPDLRLELRNLSAETCNLGAMSFQLFIGAGFVPPIRLSYQSLPGTPFEVLFAQDTSNIPAGSVLDVQIPDLSGLAPGAYPLTFQVADAQRTAAATASFLVKSVPLPPRLLQPSRDTAYVTDQPVLTWSRAEPSVSYTLEVSRSPDFLSPDQKHTLAAIATKRVSPLPPGPYFWRVISTNECGSVVSDTGAFSIHTANLSDLSTLQVAVDPNPTSGIVRFLISDEAGELGLELLGINGQHLQSFPIGRGETSKTLDLSAYPNGLYVLRIRYRQTSLSRLLVLHR
ncbi:MAG: trypsin-like peptidase domain-containing protein [Haliscomenobacter sp.]|nr:trypsin-like peptidase domain-containing protein [Haliscomenobacter sp.]